MISHMLARRACSRKYHELFPQALDGSSNAFSEIADTSNRFEEDFAVGIAKNAARQIGKTENVAVGVAQAATGEFVLYKLATPDGSALPEKLDDFDSGYFAYVPGIYGRDGNALYEYSEPSRGGGHGPLL